MDLADGSAGELQIRIEYSSPRKASFDAGAAKYWCAFCRDVIDVWPDDYRLCKSADCLQAAIRDRQARIAEFELEIARVRVKVNDEENRLLEELNFVKASGANSHVLSQYESLLETLRGSTRYYSKDRILNSIGELQRQIEAIARMIHRPVFSDEFRRYIWARDNKCCYLCRKAILDWTGVHMHIDHVIARSAGGSDDERNLRASHSNCNLKKSNRALSTRKMRAVLNELRKTDEDLRRERLF